MQPGDQFAPSSIDQPRICSMINIQQNRQHQLFIINKTINSNCSSKTVDFFYIKTELLIIIYTKLSL
jgi:hypothetical protein